MTTKCFRNVIGVVFVAISISIIAASCNSSESESFVQDDWLMHEDSLLRIRYSPQWTRVEKAPIGSHLALYAPGYSPDNAFHDYFTINMQPLQDNTVDLDSFVSLTHNQIEQFLTSPQIIEDKRVKKKGSNYHKLVYAGKYKDFDLQWVQEFHVKGDSVYILTLNTFVDNSGKYSNVGKKMFRSFEFVE